MNVFYTPDIFGNNYSLDEQESRHCIKVLRLRTGDEIYLVDGKGGFYKASLTDAHPKSCQLTIIEKEENFQKRNYYFHLAIAPTKNVDRIEWLLEKAVEIGIDEFTPVICERSERKTLNIERLEKIAVSAMKQSIKAFVTRINPCIPFRNFIKHASEEIKMVAYCNSGDGVSRTSINTIYKPGLSALSLIGPEGDFSQTEIKLALESGFKGVTMGNSRLRVETAGLYSCFALYHLNFTEAGK
jgi:16S rRNA (uracil1498-N3)-methyltransferase